MSRKQKELYRVLKEKNPEVSREIFNDQVKSEINEFIDCSPAQNQNVLFHPQVVIKSETDDVEGLGELEDLIDYTAEHIVKSKCREKFKRKNRKFVEMPQKTEELTEEYIEDDFDIEIICDFCSFGCSIKSEMESHVRAHTKKEAQRFYCEFCSREFDKVNILVFVLLIKTFI